MNNNTNQNQHLSKELIRAIGDLTEAASELLYLLEIVSIRESLEDFFEEWLLGEIVGNQTPRDYREKVLLTYRQLIEFVQRIDQHSDVLRKNGGSASANIQFAADLIE